MVRNTNKLIQKAFLVASVSVFFPGEEERYTNVREGDETFSDKHGKSLMLVAM